MDNEIITIVSGLPRSGTSMMMRMLEAGGIAPLQDGIRTADEDNPEGYYEFERAKQLPKGDAGWLPDAKGKAVKIISALVPHLPEGYQYRIIFMRRDVDEVLKSQRKMLKRRGEKTDRTTDQQMAAYFRKHLKEIVDLFKTRDDLKVLYVSYNEMMSNPKSPVRNINEFIGGGMDVAAMEKVVDPSLYRNRRGSGQKKQGGIGRFFKLLGRPATDMEE